MSVVRASLAGPSQVLDYDLGPEGLTPRDPGQLVARILRFSAKLGASDVHLRADSAPMIRLDGELRHLKHPPLSAAQVELAVIALATGAGVSADKLHAMQADFSCLVDEAGRFRAHVYRQAGTTAMVLRRIQDPIPDFATLRLPPVIKRIAMAERGLVLVAGSTGNGKSTTIASMLEYINQNATKHVVTLEDPQEFVYRSHSSSFSQRELGRDLESFDRGLMDALREDPDVVFISDLRSLSAVDFALSAAESGRLVLSTCHAPDAARTLCHLINLYPVDHRDSARNRIADVLLSVIAQRLLQRKNSRSRVLCSEILVSSPTVRDCIRDPVLFRGLSAAIAAGTHEHGSHTLDQMLLSMARDGIISVETAQAAATQPSELLRNLKR